VEFRQFAPEDGDEGGEEEGVDGEELRPKSILYFLGRVEDQDSWRIVDQRSNGCNRLQVKAQTGCKLTGTRSGDVG